ncbi:unnamed protein product, partial [Adineta steineri]
MGEEDDQSPIEGDYDQQQDATPLPVQYQLPTLSEIKTKLPSHCFRSTVQQSMSYVIKDIIYVILTFFIMFQIEKLFKYGYLFFPIYWYIQG